ncbi:MAG: hypothetical protein WBO47_06680 [Gammaproteobacteria bacterium]
MQASTSQHGSYCASTVAIAPDYGLSVHRELTEWGMGPCGPPGTGGVFATGRATVARAAHPALVIQSAAGLPLTPASDYHS